MREENFFYSTGWLPAMAAAGATVAGNINIAADVAFKAYYMTVAVRQGAAGAEVLVVNWAGELQIADSAIGKTFFNVPAAVDAVIGWGRDPYILTPPRIIASNSTLVVTVTSNVVTRTQVQVVLHGAKLYKTS